MSKSKSLFQLLERNSVFCAVFQSWVKTFYCFLLMAFFNEGLAQSHILTQNSLEMMPGYLIAHREDLQNLEAHTFGLQLNWSKDMQETSRYNWAKEYKNPRIGASLLYKNLGNEKLSGHAFAIFGHIQTNILTFTNYELNFRPAIGLAYLTKAFDVEKNHRNLAIGSHFNAALQFHFYNNFKIKNKQYVMLGIGITHFSNGSFKVPNLGINVITLQLGYQLPYKFELNEEKRLKEKSIDVLPKKKSHLIFINRGVKELRLEDPKRLIYNGIAYRYIFKSHKNKTFRAGIDLALDQQHSYVKDPSSYREDSLTFSNQFQAGLSVGYQWQIGRLQTGLDLGYYLVNPSDHFQFYQKMVGTYELPKSFYLQGMLKFHRAVADYILIGLGYGF